MESKFPQIILECIAYFIIHIPVFVVIASSLLYYYVITFKIPDSKIREFLQSPKYFLKFNESTQEAIVQASRNTTRENILSVRIVFSMFPIISLTSFLIKIINSANKTEFIIYTTLEIFIATGLYLSWKFGSSLMS